MPNKAVVTPNNLSNDFALDVGAALVRLRQVAGSTPISAADKMLLRQNGSLVEVPYAELGAKDAGSIAAFELTTAPSGWLVLNGQTVNGGATTYPDLAAVYPSWVSGGNLVLPDYRGLHLEGAGTDVSGTTLAQSTAKPAGFTVDAAGNHQHPIGLRNNDGGYAAGYPNALTYGNSNSQTATTDRAIIGSATTNVIQPNGAHTHTASGWDAKTRPASRVVLWCVKAKSGVVLGQAGTEVLTHTLTVQGGTVTSIVNGLSATAQFAPVSRVAIGAPANPNVSNPLVAPIEGETYIQSSDGTSTGLFIAEWRYKDGRWLKVNPVSQTFFGLPNPNVTSPTSIPQAGNKYILTADGTSNGLVQSVWEYTGTTWIQIGGFPTTVDIPSGTVRTYFPSYTALQHRFPPATALNAAAHGFTAVGGATFNDYVGYGAPSYRMFQLNATRPTITTAANTLYAIPASYVRKEIAINPATANQFLLQFLIDAAREVSAEVWLCDPTTGVPVKRLYGTTANESGSAADYTQFTNSRAPDNGSGYQDLYRLWVGWEIPKSLIDTYKTPTNTIKLAIRPSGDNGETNLLYICGYAMCESKYAVVHLPMLVFENTVNVAVNRNATTGGNQATWWADDAGYGNCYVPNGQNRVFDIPLTDVTKDIYLTTSGLQRSGTDTNGYGITYANFTIVHASGDVDLGRPRLDIKAPVTDVAPPTIRPMGFIIPAATLAAKATTLHANSAVQYLRVRVSAPDTSYNAHMHFIITEQVS